LRSLCWKRAGLSDEVGDPAPLQGFSPFTAMQKARAGWAEAAAALAPEVLLDDTISTKFEMRNGVVD